jgi:diaminopimelate epimerase
MHPGDADDVRFEKYHGSGNDFVLVDGEASVPDRPAFATALCDRETGIAPPSGDAPTGSGGPDAAARRGADGVLFLGLVEGVRPPRVVTTLVKPDGSVAATTGNGARCAAAWAAGRVDATEFMLDTPAGSRRAWVDPAVDATVDADGDTDAPATGRDGRRAATVVVEMGVPSFDPRDAPRPVTGGAPPVDERVPGVDLDLDVTAVDVGTPHAVAVVDDVEAVPLGGVGPTVAGAFDRPTNVTVAAPDGDGFRQRTYEFGVDAETDACGTGAIATVAVARRLDLLEDPHPTDVRVSPHGGDVAVSLPRDGPATLRGPVVREFDGRVTGRPNPDREFAPDRLRSGADRSRSA